RGSAGLAEATRNSELNTAWPLKLLAPAVEPGVRRPEAPHAIPIRNAILLRSGFHLHRRDLWRARMLENASRGGDLRKRRHHRRDWRGPDLQVGIRVRASRASR